jgi:hypothetical protein
MQQQDTRKLSLSSTWMTLGQLRGWKNQIPPLKKDPHAHLLFHSLSLYGVKLEEKGELAADQTREEGVMPGVRSYGSKLHDPLVRIQEHKTILILE